MKKLLFCSIILLFTYNAKADVGFGLMFGEPSGITIKARSGGSNDWIFNLGLKSHYGGYRFDAIYTFNFPQAFNTKSVELYAGVGPVVAVGNGNSYFYDKHDKYVYGDNDINIGAKALLGLNFKPSKQFEIFLELGPLLGLTRSFGADMEGSIGFRFYP